MRYRDREVEVYDLLPQHDPNLMELCAEHADRLVPPLGWERRDSRVRVDEEGGLEDARSAAPTVIRLDPRPARPSLLPSGS